MTMHSKVEKESPMVGPHRHMEPANGIPIYTDAAKHSIERSHV